jgi:hypothetical protein
VAVAVVVQAIAKQQVVQQQHTFRTQTRPQMARTGLAAVVEVALEVRVLLAVRPGFNLSAVEVAVRVLAVWVARLVHLHQLLEQSRLTLPALPDMLTLGTRQLR